MEQYQYIGLYNNNPLFYINKKTYLSFTTIENEQLYQFPLKKEIEIKANVFVLNRIYFLTQTVEHKTIKMYVIDVFLKQGFDVFLVDNEVKEMSKYVNKYTSFVYEENMIMLIGGINQQNKISSTILSFDLSLYKLAKQKYQELSFYPRYRHGSTSYNGIIYVIGGFTKSPESDDVIAEDVQFIKIKNNKLNKFNTAKIEGEKPILMIDPTIIIVNEKYLVSFSVYKYPKIWIMDTSNSIGKNYSFTSIPMIHLLSCQIKIDANENVKTVSYSLINNNTITYDSIILK